jgi:hypothetical protein
LAAVFVVFHIHQEPAAAAYPLPTVPVLAGLPGVQVSVADYFHELERVGMMAVAALVVAAVSSVGTAGIVGVVFGLSVDVAFVVVAGCPMQRCMVVRSGLLYG